jgi:hypothetical protein
MSALGGKRTLASVSDRTMRTAFSRPEAISRIGLVKHLLRSAGLAHRADDLSDDQPVYEMDDGRMGSFSFAPSHQNSRPSVQATYTDDDDVEVQITLYVRGDDQPTEVELWKINFEPLVSFPSPNQVKNVQAVS